MARTDETEELIAEVAQIAVLVARDEMAAGVLPADRLAHIIRAAIETYLIFSARHGAITPLPTRTDPLPGL